MLIFSMENTQMLSASSCYINTSMVGPELISTFKQHFKYSCNIDNMYTVLIIDSKRATDKLFHFY